MMSLLLSVSESQHGCSESIAVFVVSDATAHVEQIAGAVLAAFDGEVRHQHPERDFEREEQRPPLAAADPLQ